MTQKGETSYFGDILFEKSELSAGRSYVESRDWFEKGMDAQLSFIFITRCFDQRLRRMLTNYEE